MSPFGRPFAVLLLMLGTSCGSGLSADDTDNSDPGDNHSTDPIAGDLATVLLDAHNDVRAGVEPAPAEALPDLTWSAGAASVAQAWADGCHYDHNDGRGDLGENIAAFAPPLAESVEGRAAAVNRVILGWASEADYYDYAANTCAPGQVCGHYTQLVWRDTTAVGCGYRICTQNSPWPEFPSWEFWVCDYEPPGNFVGETPY